MKPARHRDGASPEKVLVVLGAAGVGLVWGWWLAPWSDGRRLQTWTAGIASCLLLAGEVMAFAALAGGLGFALGLLIGALTHAVVRHELRANRAATPTQQ